MRTRLPLLVCAALLTAAAPFVTSARGAPMSATTPTFTALAPVLIVDQVEPCLEFWTRLGFTRENEVPGADGKLVFASVHHGPVEIMYQTRASVAADNPAQAAELTGHSTGLFISLGSPAELDALEPLLHGAPVVKARHQTFYGTTELYVREPGGNVVGFSARLP
jgi:hypothetical protein